MGKVTYVRPTLAVSRKDVSFTLSKIETTLDEEIAAGETYFMRIEGDDGPLAPTIPTVRVRHASFIALGVKRIWTLEVEYA